MPHSDVSNPDHIPLKPTRVSHLLTFLLYVSDSASEQADFDFSIRQTGNGANGEATKVELVALLAPRSVGAPVHGESKGPIRMESTGPSVEKPAIDEEYVGHLKEWIAHATEVLDAVGNEAAGSNPSSRLPRTSRRGASNAGQMRPDRLVDLDLQAYFVPAPAPAPQIVCVKVSPGLSVAVSIRVSGFATPGQHLGFNVEQRPKGELRPHHTSEYVVFFRTRDDDVQHLTELWPELWRQLDAEDRESDEAFSFPEVFGVECNDLRRRRCAAGGPATSGSQISDAQFFGDAENGKSKRYMVVCPSPPPRDLRGLALSGGGIRSATFCLGVLQGLYAKGKLTGFDYLSTVSGGGYAGSFWTAWLTRSTEGQLFPDFELIEPERRDYYYGAGAGGPAAVSTGGRSLVAGALAAGMDPVHHLRLFSNHLTPRKGILSHDTWRAITVISRNLFLTWLVLLPVLFCIVVLAQGVLGTNGDPRFFRFLNDIDPKSLTTDVVIDRLLFVAMPLVVVVSWIAVMTIAWMMSNHSRFRTNAVNAAMTTSLVAFVSLVFVDKTIVKEMVLGHWMAIVAWSVVAASLVTLGLWARDPGEDDKAWRAEVRRNQLVRLHGTLLVIVVVAGVTLLISAFGPDLVRSAFGQNLDDSQTWASRLAAFVATLGATVGSVYTAVKAAPLGGGDRKTTNGSSVIRRVAFALTPPLVLLVLMVVLAWLANGAVAFVLISDSGVGRIVPISVAALIGVFTPAVFALTEMRWGFSSSQRQATDDARPRGLRTAAFHSGDVVVAIVWMLVALVTAAVAQNVGIALAGTSAPSVTGSILAALAVVLFGAPIVYRFSVFRPEGGYGWRAFYPTIQISGRRKRSPLAPAILAIDAVALVVAGLAVAWGTGAFNGGLSASPPLFRLSLAALAACSLVAMLDIVFGKGESRPALVLVLAGYVAATEGLVFSAVVMSEPAAGLLIAHVAFSWFVVAAAWIVAVGWATDPNTVSIHLFYKARLVRAYIGASNLTRAASGKRITESAKDDDLPVRSLATTEKGGPYHLVNTTLNLAAGRDLASAQRSAAPFVMSKRFCGSQRTWFRHTDTYMGGTLSLGTAVAISGAAASPNMGSSTPPAALAMLLTFLNVRLGYWAPNPGRREWRSPQARLWPFYTLREFMSQTSDLSSYCYLTDGGHFENTALYSLVERGCTFILVVDCGADPGRCFADLGNAIRRCRIDFQAEITINLEDLMASDKGLSKDHCVVGEVVYSEPHVLSLGWSPESAVDQKARTGKIVVLKPSRVGMTGSTANPADVVQYGMENDAFPQQTTADQWFDEAQWESYRRLGFHTATSAAPHV